MWFNGPFLDIFMDFAIYCLGISKILGCYTCPNNDLNFGNNNVLNFGPLIHLIYLTIHLSISLLLSRLILGFCYSLFGHIYVGFGQFSTPHFFSLIYRDHDSHVGFDHSLFGHILNFGLSIRSPVLHLLRFSRSISCKTQL